MGRSTKSHSIRSTCGKLAPANHSCFAKRGSIAQHFLVLGGRGDRASSAVGTAEAWTVDDSAVPCGTTTARFASLEPAVNRWAILILSLPGQIECGPSRTT